MKKHHWLLIAVAVVGAYLAWNWWKKKKATTQAPAQPADVSSGAQVAQGGDQAAQSLLNAITGPLGMGPVGLAVGLAGIGPKAGFIQTPPVVVIDHLPMEEA